MKTKFYILHIFAVASMFSIAGASNLPTKIKPSFDCGKAKTAVEKLVCSNNELSMQDAKMANLYLSITKITDLPNAIRLGQASWLNEARNVCEDIECLKNAYEKRNNELGNILENLMDSNKEDHRDINTIDQKVFFAYAVVSPLSPSATRYVLLSHEFCSSPHKKWDATWYRAEINSPYTGRHQSCWTQDKTAKMADLRICMITSSNQIGENCIPASSSQFINTSSLPSKPNF